MQQNCRLCYVTTTRNRSLVFQSLSARHTIHHCTVSFQVVLCCYKEEQKSCVAIPLSKAHNPSLFCVISGCVVSLQGETEVLCCNPSLHGTQSIIVLCHFRLCCVATRRNRSLVLQSLSAGHTIHHCTGSFQAVLCHYKAEQKSCVAIPLSKAHNPSLYWVISGCVVSLQGGTEVLCCNPSQQGTQSVIVVSHFRLCCVTTRRNRSCVAIPLSRAHNPSLYCVISGCVVSLQGGTGLVLQSLSAQHTIHHCTVSFQAVLCHYKEEQVLCCSPSQHSTQSIIVLCHFRLYCVATRRNRSCVAVPLSMAHSPSLYCVISGCVVSLQGGTRLVLQSLSAEHTIHHGERGGSVVECQTLEREVWGSKPTSPVLCPSGRHFTPRKYWLITQEVVAPSGHDWKIVDWDVKPQHKQTNNPSLYCVISGCVVSLQGGTGLVLQSLSAGHTIHHWTESFQAVLCHYKEEQKSCVAIPLSRAHNPSLYWVISGCVVSLQGGTEVSCCNPSQQGTQSIIVLGHFRLCCVATRRNWSLVLQSLSAQHTIHHCTESFQAMLCRYKEEQKSCVAIPFSTAHNSSLYWVISDCVVSLQGGTESCVAIPLSTAHNPSLYCVISDCVVSLPGGTEVLCCNPSQQGTQSIIVLCQFRLCSVTTRRNRSLVLQSLSAGHTIHHCTGSFQAVLCRYKEEQKSCVAIPLSRAHNPSLYWVISGCVVSLQGGTEILCCNPSQHSTQSIIVLSHFRLCCVATRRNRSLVLQSLSAQHTIHHCTESFQTVLCPCREEQKSCVAIPLSTAHNPSLYCVISGCVVSLQGGTEVLCSQQGTQSIIVLCHFRLCSVTTRRNRSLVLQSLSSGHTIHHWTESFQAVLCRYKEEQKSCVAVPLSMAHNPSLYCVISGCIVLLQGGTGLVLQSLSAWHTNHRCTVSFQAVLYRYKEEHVFYCNPAQQSTQSIIVLCHFRQCCVATRRHRSHVLQSLPAEHTIHHCTVSFQAVLCRYKEEQKSCVAILLSRAHNPSLDWVIQAVLCRYKEEQKSCVAIPLSMAHNPSLYCVISGCVVSLQGGTEVLCCNPSQQGTQSIIVLCHFRLCCVTTRRNRSCVAVPLSTAHNPSLYCVISGCIVLLQGGTGLVLQSLSAWHTVHHCTVSFQAVLYHYKEEHVLCCNPSQQSTQSITGSAIPLSRAHNPSRGARWLSGRVSDSGARGLGFETYLRCVVSLSKTLYSPKVLVNYPGSGGSVPTWLKNCWLGR